MTGPYRLPDGWRLAVVEHGAGVTVLEVEGEIDTVTAAPLDAALQALVREGETVVVDLSQVRFLGSHGLAALLEGAEQARRRGGRLVVVPGSDNRAVLRPLTLTGLDRRIEIASGSAREAAARPCS